MVRSFCGEYRCAADAKGRLMIPAKIREMIPEGETMVLARSLDHCINLYTEEKWASFEEMISTLPETESRNVRRFFFSSMQYAEPDGQGRVLLPAVLREYAKSGKNVVVLGCGDHAEIWDEETYDQFTFDNRTEEIENILKRHGL